MEITLKIILLLQWNSFAENFDEGQGSEVARMLPAGSVLVNPSDVDDDDVDKDQINQETAVIEAKPKGSENAPNTNKRPPEIIKTVNQSVFPTLDNYHDGATLITETEYPWIARIVHSKTLDYPFMCTASCIEKQIFITAARCIPQLKLEYTTVIYMRKRLHPIALLLPSTPTKQMYDDIGIIVTSHVKMHWETVKLFQGNRTDSTYGWLAQLHLYKSTDHVAVGYASDKDFAKLHTPYTTFQLYEMKIHVGITLCTVYGRKIGYYVPCYHACDLTKPSDPVCKKYLGTEGAAVYNTKTKRLLGVATWGGKKVHELPVGFSVPNSNSFFQDLACARKIVHTKVVNPKKDYFQKLCGRH